jgi:hypothetical protein
MVRRCSIDDEKKMYSELLQNMLKYIQIPVIMKKTDDNNVGVWPDKVNKMEKRKLKTVPESESEYYNSRGTGTLLHVIMIFSVTLGCVVIAWHSFDHAWATVSGIITPRETFLRLVFTKQ